MSDAGETGDVDRSQIARRVSSDWPCARCGYNLRTLPQEGICPECAFSVAESLKRRDVPTLPAAWLRSAGRSLIFVALTAIVAITVNWALGMHIVFGPGPLPRAVGYGAYAVQCAALGAALVGVLRFRQLFSAETLTPPEQAAVRATLWTAIAALGCRLVAFMNMLIGVPLRDVAPVPMVWILGWRWWEFEELAAGLTLGLLLLLATSRIAKRWLRGTAALAIAGLAVAFIGRLIWGVVLFYVPFMMRRAGLQIRAAQLGGEWWAGIVGSASTLLGLVVLFLCGRQLIRYARHRADADG